MRRTADENAGADDADKPAAAGGAAGSRGVLVRIDRSLPLLKYLGFSFWVAWFGIAYSSTVWITPDVEATSAVVTEMFVISTLAHVLPLVACALAYRKANRLLQDPRTIAGGALLAALGCLFIILAGPTSFSSHQLFIAGSVFTGLGTAVLCMNSGVLLCRLKPAALLRTLLICELAASLVGCMVTSMPSPVASALFVGILLVSGACLVVGTATDATSAADERERLRPTREFTRFLVAAFVLCATTRIVRDFFITLETPEQLGFEGSLVTLATIGALVALLVGSSLGRRPVDFGRLFYSMAGIIAAAVALCGFVPGSTGFGGVLSSTAFQLFDIATWFACGYIAHQSKASSIMLVACVRAVFSAGVTLGAFLGALAAQNTGTATLPVWLTCTLLAIDVLAVAAIFPPRRVSGLLLPIPDEDDPVLMTLDDSAADQGERGERSRNAKARPGEKTAGIAGAGRGGEPGGAGDCQAGAPLASNGSTDTGDVPDARPGRWKAGCLALADEIGLTDREKEVFVLLAKGRGSQSISDALTISLYTTRAHTRNIYAKLDVHSRHELSEQVQRYIDGHRV